MKYNQLNNINRLIVLNNNINILIPWLVCFLVKSHFDLSKVSHVLFEQGSSNYVVITTYYSN